MRAIKCALFICLNISSLLIFSQNETARLSIIAGRKIDFVFSSNNSIQNGLTYNNFTRFEIYYIDTSALGVPETTWELLVRANTASIISDDNSPAWDLDLETIEVLAVDGGGATDLSAYCKGTKWALTSVDEPLVSNAPQGKEADNKINITYECGTNGTYSLENKNPGHYSVLIIYTLGTF
jgi:hypothetical protein